jgi:hypothetical protein
MESPTLEQSSSKKQYDEPSNSFAQDAKLATDKEQSMTLMQGIRLYPKAIGWSIVISTCIAMEGYDLCLLGNFCESRELRRDHHRDNKLILNDLELRSPRRIPSIQRKVW